MSEDDASPKPIRGSEDTTDVIGLQMRDVPCAACGKPADWTGPGERVQCDCGTTVCAACCIAHEGESYCFGCYVDRIRAEARAEGYAQAERDIADWLRHVCLERGSARAMADCIEGGEHRPVDGSDSDD